MGDSFILAAAVLSGIFLGGFTAFIILKGNIARAWESGAAEAGRENAALAERIKGLDVRALEYRKELDEKNRKIDALTERLSSLQERLSVSETTLFKERSQNEEKIALLNSAKEELTAQFKAISGDIFDSRNKVFTSQTSSALDQLLRPFREQIENFKKQLDTSREADLSERASLKTEIQKLAKLNQQITEEAENLTKALRGEVKTQGTWGEMVLEKVLEKSGLVRGREFEVQESLKSPDGRRYQPDVIVHLPEGRDIVIDSKVSLVAYERLVASDNEIERLAAEKDLVL